MFKVRENTFDTLQLQNSVWKCPDFYHIVPETEVTGLVSKCNIKGFLITYKGQLFKFLCYIVDYIIALSIIEEVTVDNLKAKGDEENTFK